MEMGDEQNIHNIPNRKSGLPSHIILNPSLVQRTTPILLCSLKTSAIKNDVSDIFSVITIKPFCVEGSMTDWMECSD